MTCDNCHSDDMVLNHISNEVVCNKCGIVSENDTLLHQFERGTENFTPTNSKKNTNVTGSYFLPSDTGNENLKRTQKYYSSEYYRLRVQARKITEILNEFSTKLNINAEVKKEIQMIHERIMLKVPLYSKIRITLVVALILFYNKKGLMTTKEIFKKLGITKQTLYLKCLTELKDEFSYKRVQPETLKRDIIIRLLNNKEFNEKIKHRFSREFIFNKINREYDKEINKFPAEYREKRQTIAKVLYIILRQLKPRIISFEILADVSGTPSTTIRTLMFKKKRKPVSIQTTLI